MAKKTKLYNVGYGQNRGEPNVDFDVDLSNLPYDKAAPGDPLVIFFEEGEEQVVYMGKSKGRPWPDFGNVCIAGALDCQDFTIDANTVLPICFDKLICRHSINDLGVLMGLLPADFMTAPEPTIVVRTAILNNVKSNKDGALSTARRFTEMYPNVIVTDGKQKLSEILIAIEHANSTTQSDTSVAKKKTPVQTTPFKTDEWLSADEVAERCKEISPVIAELSQEQIIRHIKMARSSRAGLGLNVCEMLRADDNAKLVCTHESEVQRIVDFIQASISEQTNKKANPAQKTDKKTDKEQPVLKNIVQKYYIGEREVKPIKIKKYISKAAYGQIQALCGTSTNDLLRILTDIDKVNIPPSTKDGDKVLYVEDNQLKTSTTIHQRGGGACLAQGFGTLNNRPRIVWCVSKNYFVCQKVFATHDARNKQYDDYVNHTKINVDELDLSEYLYVPDLIKELSASHMPPTPPAELEEQKKPAKQVVAERIVETDVKVMPAAPETSDAPVAIKRGRGRPRIVRVTHEQNVRPGTKTDDTSTATPDAPVPQVQPAIMSSADNVPDTTASTIKPDIVQIVQIPSEPIVPNTAESNVMWQELASISYKYEQRLQLLTGTQKVLIQQLSCEKTTEKLIQTTRNLQYILEQKQECERAIEKMRQMNDALAELKKKLDEHKI